MDHFLPETKYLKFPFEVGESGPMTSGYQNHIREKIEQVLFTDPGERVFRPEFGAGVRRLVFEPNHIALMAIIKKRLQQSLEEALRGDVAAKDLKVEVYIDPGVGEFLTIEISYLLPAINFRETLKFEGS